MWKNAISKCAEILWTLCVTIQCHLLRCMIFWQKLPWEKMLEKWILQSWILKYSKNSGCKKASLNVYFLQISVHTNWSWSEAQVNKNKYWPHRFCPCDLALGTDVMQILARNNEIKSLSLIAVSLLPLFEANAIFLTDIVITPNPLIRTQKYWILLLQTFCSVRERIAHLKYGSMLNVEVCSMSVRI